MQEHEKTVHVRFAPSRGSLEAGSGHRIRTLTEREICEWLTERRVAHKHASEVFIIKSTSNGSPSLFVPDILLTKKKSRDGKTIIIETLHSFSPKKGGLRTFTTFCKQYLDEYFSILVAKKSTLESIPKGVCNARVELENLAILTKKFGIGSDHP